ncbi:transposase zinc-binding domain-containing protein [Novosphingobium sp. G106]|nr:transposase zinc-binding domain-containing protein [Novosphingobium sp. G106]
MQTTCAGTATARSARAAREQWLADRKADLLPVPYFHVVFTVPAEAAAIAYQNKRQIYAILFDAVAETLKTIAPRSPAPGRRARLHRHTSHLGTDAHLSSTYPPPGARWRPIR